MHFRKVFSSLALLSLLGCASTPSMKSEKTGEVNPEVADSSLASETLAINPEPTKKSDSGYLICKASKRRFHYDWSAGSLRNGQEVIDQNNIRYEFRSAGKPAGNKGENLKVGECGWAKVALVSRKKAPKSQVKSQVIFKSLSDEATQTFYKMKTGKVFKFPVRQTKNGLEAMPGGIRLIR
ncbi:MAG TPA: hypothetical protein VIG33_08900 [Pseudobdellovibrionaceae bacterium]|jgi:hypothetical protein